jgi:lipid-A-disaccharide synthase-like uncharacterized protein
MILAQSQGYLSLFRDHPWWVLLGLFGELLFMSRFVVQWVASERAGRSFVPLIFWYLSLGGTALLTVYAVWRQDPVFILGQTLPAVIYVRNIVLVCRERKNDAAAVPAGDAPRRLAE